MKKIFLLIALIAYAFGNECGECVNKCKEKYPLPHAIKRIKCNNNCYKGPCRDVFD